MELVFLGTGAGMPSRERNVAGIALSWAPRGNHFWLFDCGEATQHRLWDSGLSLHRLTRIYITHLHGDHLFGLPGILATRSAQGASSPLYVGGPDGLEAWIRATCQTSGLHLNFPLNIETLSPSMAPPSSLLKLHSVDGATVHAAWLEHGLPSLGFRIEENSSPGSLDAERLSSLGVPPGPLYGRLKRGEDIELSGGEIVRSQDVLGPPNAGRVVAILGDTRPTPAAIQLSKYADALVHEGTFSAAHRDNAHAFGHSTVQDAAHTAKTAEVKRLILTHISARYKAEDIPELSWEAQSIFPETQIAYDGFRTPIDRASLR